MILPWSIKESEELGAIFEVESFPTMLADFRKHIDKCRPKQNSDVWVKIWIAHELAPVHFTSTGESSTVYWFDEYKSKSFLCPLQTSDKSISIGAFLYSGTFIDPARMAKVIVEELESKEKDRTRKDPNATKREWKIACRNKTSREIAAKEDGGWQPMSARTMTHVEADHHVARSTNYYLYRRFNKQTENPPPPPGMYKYLRYLPAKEYVTSGGGNERPNMLKKHEAVIESLEMVTIDSVKHLDKEYKAEDGQIYTLRTFMMEQTFPLAPKPNSRTKALIHSIDWTSSGMDAGTRVIITAYKDRKDVVYRLAQILPEYVEYAPDEGAKKAWFNHQTMPQDVQFLNDIEGNWNGKWTTEDDRVNASIIVATIGRSFSAFPANQKDVLGQSFHAFPADGERTKRSPDQNASRPQTAYISTEI